MTDQTVSAPAESREDGGALVPLTASAPGARHPACWRVVVYGLFALALLLGAAFWVGQQQWQRLRAQQVQDLAVATQAYAHAQQALDAVQAHTTQLLALQAEQARIVAQLQALQASPPVTLEPVPIAPLSTSQVLLASAQHALLLAGQQLQSGIGTDAVIAMLESVQTRVAQQGAFTLLQQALQQDIARLRATPVVDRSRLAAHLDTLEDLIRRAPLLMPERAPGAAGQTSVPQATVSLLPATPPEPLIESASWGQRAWQQTRVWLHQAWQAIAQDLRGLVQVRRVDDATALLLSPEQTGLLRSTLQHRVAAARLALLMREPQVWHAELNALQAALEARFDVQHADTQQALTLVRALRDTAVRVDVSTLETSLDAVQALYAAGTASGVPDRPVPVVEPVSEPVQD